MSLWCWKRPQLEFSPFRKGLFSTASCEMTQRFLCPLGSPVHVTPMMGNAQSPVVLQLGHACRDAQGWAASPSAIPASDSFLLFVAGP